MNVANSARIDLRVESRKKEIITRAAAMRGINITQFIMDMVYPEAERIVAEENRARLSRADWQRFAAKLDEAPRDLPKLRRLMRESSIFAKK